MTMRPRTFSALWAAALGAMLVAVAWSTGAVAQETISFKEDVFPILELRCLECHQSGGAGYEASGLDLGSYDSVMKGTKFGPVVTPGNAFESNLIAVIDQRTHKDIWMPQNKRRLSKCERLTLRFWIMQGARNN